MIRAAIIVLIIIGGLVGNQFYSQYRMNGNNISLPFFSDSNETNLTKCITKDGQTIYGIIPEGTVCVKSEPIKISINSSEQSKLSKPLNLPTTSSITTNYRCDGRQHCSQMTSCAEAKFFLKNCPNTKMDGEGDGIPCEKQWCN